MGFFVTGLILVLLVLLVLLICCISWARRRLGKDRAAEAPVPVAGGSSWLVGVRGSGQRRPTREVVLQRTRIIPSSRRAGHCRLREESCEVESEWCEAESESRAPAACSLEMVRMSATSLTREGHGAKPELDLDLD